MGEAVGEARPAVDFGEKLGDVAIEQATGSDRGDVIVSAMIEHLREGRILLNAEVCPITSNLPGDEGEHIGRGHFSDAEHATGKPQIGKIDRESDSVGNTSALTDQ